MQQYINLFENVSISITGFAFIITKNWSKVTAKKFRNVRKIVILRNHESKNIWSI
jgi:hypothetical protein